VSDTELVGVVRRAGDAIVAPDASPESVSAAVSGDAAVSDVHVVARADGTPDTAELTLSPPVPLASLEAAFGAGRALPRSGPGAPQVVLLGDGSADWSVLASVSGDAVDAVTVRREL
jgi:hypothetical protein